MGPTRNRLRVGPGGTTAPELTRSPSPGSRAPRQDGVYGPLSCLTSRTGSTPMGKPTVPVVARASQACETDTPALCRGPGRARHRGCRSSAGWARLFLGSVVVAPREWSGISRHWALAGSAKVQRMRQGARCRFVMGTAWGRSRYRGREPRRGHGPRRTGCRGWLTYQAGVASTAASWVRLRGVPLPSA